MRSSTPPGVDEEPREKEILDRVCLFELRARGPSLVEMALRRGGEPLRARTILLRNAHAGGWP